jgi:hypothetical protein
MDDGKNINIVTQGGDDMGDNVAKHNPSQHHWVKKNTAPQKNFYAREEKEMFKENIVSTSTMQKNHDRPMYEMPPSMDHTSKGKTSEKVSNLKIFLQSCVNLLNDPSSIKVL